jgi:glycosyltransferase involved in cell wall biosynthesis
MKLIGYSFRVENEKVDYFASIQPIKLLSVIIAAYNEANTIAQTLTNLHTVLKSLTCSFEIIVVESNSTDETRNILKKFEKELDLKLFFQENPRGKGSAIRLGMNQMLGDVFLIYDADAEYDPADIPRLLIPIENGNTSFVLGTRHENGKAMRTMQNHKLRPILMNSAHKFFCYLINKSCKVSLTDPFTMYKVCRSEIFKDIRLTSNRFDLDWELVIKAIRLGSNPVEIPVAYTSRSFSEGKKVRFFRDPINWLIAYFKFRFLPI